MNRLKFFSPLMVFFLTCLLMLSYGGFSWDVFLVDDNVCQWYPITEKAYEQLFRTGTMPSYNFFLLNGFPIANMGYYSLYNPFMLVAYLLERVLPFNMFAIYICILSGLGNVVLYLFCRMRKKDIRFALLVVLACSSAACFVAFHNWYYAFNNYFIIPLLVYSIFYDTNKKTLYVSSGIILALDALLGNIQFVCFHYIVFIFFMLGMWLIDKERNFLCRFTTNISVALILSLPIIILGLNASSDFGGKDAFLARSTSNASFFISSIGLLELKHIPWMQKFSYAAALTVPLWVGGTTVVYSIVFRFKECAKNTQVFTCLKINLLVLFLIIFWLNYSEGGLLAIAMSKLPVVSKFRYLYKAYFVLIPLLALYLVFLEAVIKQHAKKILCMVVFAFSVIGVVNNFFVYDHTRSLFVSDGDHYSENLGVTSARESLLKNDVLYQNYRIVSFYSDDSLSIDKFFFDKSLNRNYPAFLESFSLAAYEIASPKSNLKKINRIYSDTSFMTRYGNTGSKAFLLENIHNYSSELDNQFRSNSVKYLLIERDSIIPLESLIHEMASLGNVYVERMEKFNEMFDLVVLGGIPSLCRFDDGSDVQLQTERMDLLSFNAEKSGDYILSFIYEKKLQAYYMNNDGSKEYLEIGENEDNNVRVTNVPQGKRVYLTYYDPVCQWAKIFEIVISILFGVALLQLFKLKRNMFEC